MAHLVDGVRQVVVVFEEIEGAKAQKLKGDTHVAMVVKPVKHLDTEAGKRWGRGTVDELYICLPHGEGLHTGTDPKVQLS